MSPNEVAKKLGLSVQSVYKYKQDGSIKAEAVPYGDERITYVTSETAYPDAIKYQRHVWFVMKIMYLVSTYPIFKNGYHLKKG